MNKELTILNTEIKEVKKLNDILFVNGSKCFTNKQLSIIRDGLQFKSGILKKHHALIKYDIARVKQERQEKKNKGKSFFKLWYHGCECHDDISTESFYDEKKAHQIFFQWKTEKCEECGKIGLVELTHHRNKYDERGKLIKYFSDLKNKE